MRCYFRATSPSWLRGPHPLVYQVDHLKDRKMRKDIDCEWAVLPGLLTDVPLIVHELEAIAERIGTPTWVASVDSRPSWEDVQRIQGQAIDIHQRLNDLAGDEFTFRPSLLGATGRDLIVHADLWTADCPEQEEFLVGVPPAVHNLDALKEPINELLARDLKLHLLNHDVGNVNSKELLKLFRGFDTASYRAFMKEDPLPSCKHKVCKDCLPKALAWERKQLSKIRVNEPTLLEA